MLRRIHRSIKYHITLGVACIICICISFVISYFYVRSRLEQDYIAKVNGLQTELNLNHKTVYMATREIKEGELIGDDMVSVVEGITMEPEEQFMREEDIGKISLVRIPEGTYIHKNMIGSSEFRDGIREVMFQCIKLYGNMNKEDVVDVRINLPNGENYIVLSKKKLYDLTEDKLGCYLWLKEEEIQYMSSAIVDAYLYEGAYLYTTKYIKPTVQDASVITYQPSLQTMELIKSNPNIVSIAELKLSDAYRQSMERRLQDHRNHCESSYTNESLTHYQEVNSVEREENLFVTTDEEGGLEENYLGDSVKEQESLN